MNGGGSIIAAISVDTKEDDDDEVTRKWKSNFRKDGKTNGPTKQWSTRLEIDSGV